MTDTVPAAAPLEATTPSAGHSMTAQLLATLGNRRRTGRLVDDRLWIGEKKAQYKGRLGDGRAQQRALLAIGHAHDFVDAGGPILTFASGFGRLSCEC